MDETCSESDVSLSPSQILERLQVLRQLQLLQRGKLQKQRLQYKETSETTSSITEIVSHFSNSTSYNTFRSLLQTSNDFSSECTPRQTTSDLSPRVQDTDLIDGVSVLNLSQESEFVVSSPISSRSRISESSRSEQLKKEVLARSSRDNKLSVSPKNNVSPKKQISLDDMPILSPKQDFEDLLLEKLESEKNMPKPKGPSKNNLKLASKKPFLKRGEGMARFGLNKKQLVIQNTKSLPWKKKDFQNKIVQSPCIRKTNKIPNQNDVEMLVAEPPSLAVPDIKIAAPTKKLQIKRNSDISSKSNCSEKILEKSSEKAECEPSETKDSQAHIVDKPLQNIKSQKNINKHPFLMNKGKTWAAVLTKEQDDFLRQLKQSDYYKNFVSPSKSVVSDVSCDEPMGRIRQEREVAEQNMFDLLENKVSNESFSIENSFFNRFLRRNLECSGESTPLVLQKCLSQNPELMHILPELRDRHEKSQCDAETCSEYSECCSDACSSVSCCSCKTVEQPSQTNKSTKDRKNENAQHKDKPKKDIPKKVESKSQDDTMTEDDNMKASMAAMNAKLIGTSELLKERLQELEDEIETFRKENSNLAALRQEVDQERQKFYEEKAAFEQKFNEDKVLSEYYLAEEKEKLSKQKQMYERYVREMRGRLNKKDKDEVVNLKKEINDLKDEIRLKDAKSTSTIARLRNHIKMIEKEKKELNDEVEKLKKQNRRIQHGNEITRRLTNIKYLEEINKKLTNIQIKDTRSEVGVDRNIKYKAYEIERQSRSKKIEPVSKTSMRPRAKSVPNLNVTSRYAKYFSQRDTASHIEQNTLPHIQGVNTDEILLNHSESLNDIETENEDDNDLEKLYLERFKSISPNSNRPSGSHSNRFLDKPDLNDNAKSFFFSKSMNSKSPNQSLSPYLNNSGSSVNRSKSPVSILSNKSNSQRSPNLCHSTENVSNNTGSNGSQNRSKSPVSFTTKSTLNNMTATVIHNDQFRDKLSVLSPEPTSSKTSFTKTNLNPTERRKPDGSRELHFPNGNIKHLSADGTYSKFTYYNGDVKENFYNEGRIKYFYAETKTFHTTHADGLEVLEFPDGQVEKRYKDGSSEIRLPNGSVRYFDPKNQHVREEWRFPDGAALTVAASGEQRIVFSNGQVEVHAKDHKRREFPDGTVKLVYNDGTSETRYASGRVRIKDKHGYLIMDSATG